MFYLSFVLLASAMHKLLLLADGKYEYVSRFLFVF